MMKGKNEAAETKEGIRKTIYIDETLVKRAEMFEELAEVNSFSAFVSKAQENTAKMRGQIDVGRIIGEMSTENEEDDDDYN